jgi:hypothetical protein
MSFYLTLPHTASRAQFPDNRIGKYTTLLAQNIELEGQWEVGLCEIILPTPKLVLPSDTSFSYSKGKDDLMAEVHISPKWFYTFSDLEPLNCSAYKFTYHQDQLTLVVSDGIHLKFNDDFFPKLLGFPKEIVGLGKEGTKVSSIPASRLELAYIYCDICEQTFIGDSMVPCIRAVPLSSQKPTVVTYENVHYVNLRNTRFSTVSIDISDDTGKTIDFTVGLSLVKIHLRPKK